MFGTSRARADGFPFACAMAVLGVASPAAGASKASPCPAAECLLYADPAPESVDTVPVGISARVHDGFYLRSAFGLGGADVNRETEVDAQAASGEASEDGSAGGLFGSVELALGGTLLRGTSIAAWLNVQALLGSASGTEFSIERGYRMLLVGALLDYFPWERGGFHFGTGVGVVEASGNASEAVVERVEGVGFALAPQVGYDLWVGSQWSLGIQGRATVAFVSGTQRISIEGLDVSAREFSRIVSFTLALSALFH